MKLIFIYGPPACGKLTIAQELVKLTGYKLYHNHLACDLVESIFDREKYKHLFFTLISEINLLMVSRAVKEAISGIIMTSCYIHPDEEEFIQKIITAVSQQNSEIYFVQIRCDEEELKKRATQESRRIFGKLMDTEILHRFLHEKNLDHKIVHTHSLSIDTMTISAEESAQKIKNYYLL